MGCVEDPVLLVRESPAERDPKNRGEEPDVRHRDCQTRVSVGGASKLTNDGPGIDEVLEHVRTDDEIEAASDRVDGRLNAFTLDPVVDGGRLGGARRIELDADDLARSVTPVPRRVETSTAADVEDTLELAADPIEKARPVAGVVIGGLFAQHDAAFEISRTATKVQFWQRGESSVPSAASRASHASASRREAASGGGNREKTFRGSSA